MKNICISSDVEASHLILDFDFLLEVLRLELSGLKDDRPFIRLDDDQLNVVNDAVEKTVEKLLLNRKEPEEMIAKKLESGKTVELRKNLTDIEYGGRLLKFDLRDEDDFNLCAYIDLLSMMKSCVQLKGSLYFFNRELLEKYEGASIVGFLRLNQSKKKSEIENGLSNLWQRLKINNTIDGGILAKGLNNLMNYGLVDHDKRKDEYRLTARGFMFW